MISVFNTHIALSAAGNKTLLQVYPLPTTIGYISSFWVSFSDATIPVRVRLLRQTTAGTGSTSFSNNFSTRIGGTLSGVENYTVEPTYGAIIWDYYVSGSAQVSFPIHFEPHMKDNTERIGIVATIPAVYPANCTAGIWARSEG